MRDRAALGRVFALGLDGDRIVSENIQMAFSIGLLEEFSAFGLGRDRIKNASLGNPRLGMVRDELISICSNPNSGKTSSNRHRFLSLCPAL